MYKNLITNRRYIKNLGAGLFSRIIASMEKLTSWNGQTKVLPLLANQKEYWFNLALHWTLSGAKLLQSTPHNLRSCSLRSILILHAHLCLDFQVISSLQTLRPTTCMIFFYLSRVLRDPYITYSSIYSSYHHLSKSTICERRHYIIFSSLLFSRQNILRNALRS